MDFYKKEYCYLTPKGKTFVDFLISKGIDEDLALEVAHISIPNDELYQLEDEAYEKRRMAK
jgi:hypothetical protein